MPRPRKYPKYDQDEFDKHRAKIEKQLAPKKDAVDHPLHYGGDVPYEVIKVLLAWERMFPSMTWDVLTAIKYLPRAGEKNPDKHIEDLEKAVWYIQSRIDVLKKERNA